MPRRALLGLIVLTVAAPDARPDALATLEEEQTALFERVAPAVVVIRSGDARSTGFAVGPGLVVTAAHALHGEREVEVTFHDGRALRGEVVEAAPGGLDIALVRVPGTPPRVLELSASPAIHTGTLVAVVAHGEGLLWSLSTGLVSSAEPAGPDAALVALQIPLRPGASGGPVVDRAGRVVGIVAQGATGIAFAVRSDAVLRAFPELAAAGDARVPIEAAAAGVADEAPIGPPLRAPELIVAPADARPAPARVARAAVRRAKVARAIPLPRRDVRMDRSFVSPAPQDTTDLLRELTPVAAVGSAGLALAALVLASFVGASALGASRPSGRRRHRRLEARARLRPVPHRLRRAGEPVLRDGPPLAR